MPMNYLPKDDHSDHSEIFFKYKHQRETLGITTFGRDVLFETENSDNKVETYIQSFFNFGIQFYESNYKYHLDPVHNPHLDKIAGYTETSVLTKEFLVHKGFRSPLSCKWHPHAEKWLVHPGRTRCRVLHYFLEGDIDVYAFNTQGIVSPTYKHVFNSKEEITDYITQKTGRPAVIKIYCSAYFGSLLPDVYLYEPSTTVTSNYLNVTSFFRSTKINANFDLSMFDYSEQQVLKTPKKEVTIRVESQDYDTLIRAMLLLPCYSNYEGYGVTIKTQT